jgi:hypothetical protein
MSEILKLAEDREQEYVSRYIREFPDEFEINAFLYHNPMVDSRLLVRDEDVERRGLGGGYVVVPVQFFHVDVEVPPEIRMYAELLKNLGI